VKAFYSSKRPSWNTYFLRIADVVATRATCPRKAIGAVFVDAENRIISTGYNGAPSGAKQCDEVGCELVEGHCIRTLHAECNALLYADSQRLRGAKLYISGYEPCLPCAKLLVVLGIKAVFAHDQYEQSGRKFLEEAGVKVYLVSREK